MASNENAVTDDQKSDAALSKMMSYSKNINPHKAIYAIREVCQKDVYQTRGMGCLVHIKGSERLLTWRGVDLGKGDRDKSIIMDRFTSPKTSSKIGEYRFQSSTAKEIDSFSFLSVGPVNEAGNATNPSKKNWRQYLELQVPKETKCDFKAYSFVGNKELELNLMYNVTKKKHELVINNDISKQLILEKTSLLGAPIIICKNLELSSPYCVVGVVGWSDNDRQLIPYFITEELLDQESSSKEASSGADRTYFLAQQKLATETDVPDSSVQPPIEQKPSTMDNPKVVTGISKGKQPASTSASTVRGKQPASTSASTVRGPIVGESAEKVRGGGFPLAWLPYLALDIQAFGKGSWKSVGRDLGLEPGVLNGIDDDNDEGYERCYKMLKTWYQKNTIHSFEDVANVLKKQGMDEIREDYCLLEHDPPTQKVVDIANLKIGVVNDDDLRGIAEDVRGKRKKFGRALGVSDDDLDKIVEENKGDISEQSYQIVRKWRQSNKKTDITYNALAQALLDRTVKMDIVMSKFCLVRR